MKRIAWYITPHGYGHGARSTDLIRTVAARRPEVVFVVCTTLSESFLRARLVGVNFTIRSVALDVGMVQADSVRVDLAATLKNLRGLLDSWDTRVAEEVDWLDAADVDGVVADISGIALEAGARGGVPTVAVGNFGWDWIYEDFLADPDSEGVWQEAVARYRSAYAKTDLLIRLPFSEPMAAFPNQKSVPLVAHAGQAQRERIALRTGADPDDLWVLLSFTTLDWSGEARERVSQISGVQWFTMEPFGWPDAGFHMITRSEISPMDIFATVDVVLTKPGYGVLSDCTVNAKPIIHVERENFREYPILRRAVEKHMASVFLPVAKLYEGDLAEAIAEVRKVGPATNPVDADRGEAAARLLLEVFLREDD